MRTDTTRHAQKRPARRIDAVALLKKDHANVLAMFKKFDGMTEKKGDGGKAGLVKKICEELKAHTAVEEEIFYPAVRAAIDEELLMDEAEVEHKSAKDLIDELEGMQPGDDRYDAKVTVLGEFIKHHVKEEHEEMFPKAKKAKVDMAALGEQMAARKQELAAGAAPAQ
jgi:hemerythrin-like domain-containing protein